MLSLVWEIKWSKGYLYGREFTILTNNQFSIYKKVFCLQLLEYSIGLYSLEDTDITYNSKVQSTIQMWTDNWSYIEIKQDKSEKKSILSENSFDVIFLTEAFPSQMNYSNRDQRDSAMSLVYRTTIMSCINTHTHTHQFREFFPYYDESMVYGSYMESESYHTI